MAYYKLNDNQQNRDYDIRQALRVIKGTYGDLVSVDKKRKNLLKFGYRADAGAAKSTLMVSPSGVANETYARRNIITTLSSSSASDIETVTVEGHVVGDDVSVSSITQAGGTATVTAPSHGFTVGEWVYFEGANQAGYNGIVQVLTVPTANTFTYSVDAATASPATGTITATSQNKTFVVQDVTLNGQNQVTLTTPIARAGRLFPPSQNRAADLVGTVYVYRAGTATAGVPDTDADVHLMTRPGFNQSEKAATSLSSTDYWILTSFEGGILLKQAGFAEVILEVREEGGLFRPIDRVPCSSPGGLEQQFFRPYVVVPKNSDIRLSVIAGAESTPMAGSISGYLAEIL